MRAQPAAERFWTAIAEGRFELPRCEICSTWQEPDAEACERCGAPTLGWAAAPSGGAVFSSMEPLSGTDGHPLTIVVVGMDAGLRMMGVVEVAPGSVPVGIRVAIVVPAVPETARLPLFAESAK